MDFDAEGRNLWNRLNLDPSQVSQGVHKALDPLWRHPGTGAVFYVGNQTAAQSMDILQKYGVTHVVNCTDNMPNFLEDQGRMKYFRFNIVSHFFRVHSDEDAVAFVRPMLEFVGNALAEGNNVMAHCLAGAHRAGTTGCLCLMYFAQLHAWEAVMLAKRCRPIIDPIGDFPRLLDKFDRGRAFVGVRRKSQRSGR